MVSHPGNQGGSARDLPDPSSCLLSSAVYQPNTSGPCRSPSSVTPLNPSCKGRCPRARLSFGERRFQSREGTQPRSTRHSPFGTESETSQGKKQGDEGPQCGFACLVHITAPSSEGGKRDRGSPSAWGALGTHRDHPWGKEQAPHGLPTVLVCPRLSSVALGKPQAVN